MIHYYHLDKILLLTRLKLTELTPYILNKLISKIEIGCLETIDGEKQQMVSVEWRFQIGIFILVNYLSENGENTLKKLFTQNVGYNQNY